MAETFYQGDVGVGVLVDCGRDISTATNKAILVRKPDGALATWVASVSETTKLSYTTTTDDLAQHGTYKLQSSMTLGDWTGRGKTATLIVLPHFS